MNMNRFKLDKALEQNRSFPLAGGRLGWGLARRKSCVSTPSLALPLQGGGDIGSNGLPGLSSTHRRQRNAAVLLATTLASAPFAAHADEREDMINLRATVLSLVETLVKNGILPRDKADAMMREAESRAAAKLAQMPPAEAGPDGKKIVRVPYVPESVKVQMRDQIKAEVLAETRAERQAGSGAAEGASRIQFGGDFRLRAETARMGKTNTPANGIDGIYSDSSNAGLTRAPDIWTNTSNGIHNFNTQQNASRDRVRARLGMTARISDEVSVGVALATGSTTGPTSTNQTMAQGAGQTPGYFNKYGVAIDRAYIKYDHDSWLSISGGRMPNPYFGTDLLWADDLNFEGFAMTVKPFLGTSPGAFFTAGWFPLSFNIPNQTHGRSLLAVQGGYDWKIGQMDNHLKLAAALYNYHGIEGVAQTATNYLTSPDYLSSEYGPGYRQRGNTLFRINAPNSGANPDTATNWGLASSFRELDLTGTADIAQFDPVHVVLTGDLVKNLDFNRNEMSSRTGSSIADGKSIGLLGRIQVGAPKMAKRGDWNVSLAYRYLGSDAVLDAFTNSDFGLGGTNSKGTILGMNYGVDKNTWVSARWMSSDPIDSMVPTGPTKTKFAVDLIQIDLNARF